MTKRRLAEHYMEKGYLQCMGCRGFGPAEEYSWHKHKRYGGTVFQYCTDKCRQKDGAEPEKEE